MKHFHLLHALVPVLILVLNRAVSAVGRGPTRAAPSLGYEANPSNRMHQGPSPAELEDQEEDDGLDQEGAPPPGPVQMLMQGPARPKLSEADASGPVSTASNFQGPQVQRPTRQFLSYPAARGQFQGAWPQRPHAIENIEANNEVVEPLMGAPIRYGAGANAFQSRVDLGLSALVARPAPIPSMAQPMAQPIAQPAKAIPFPMTVPGIYSPLPSRDYLKANPLFPPTLPLSMAGPSPPAVSEASSLHAEPSGWPPSKGKRFICHPPCISDRGICNDSLCFCKSPYTGTTCQHKVSQYSRINHTMLVAASLVCLVFGLIFAQLLHGFVTSRYEQRLIYLGDGSTRQEVWMPPDNSKKKKGGS